MTEPWRQQRSTSAIKAVPISLQKVDSFADRLEHPELDPVVDELREVAGARGARVDVAALHSKIDQDRLDPRHRFRVAARHEAGPGASPFDAAARAQIDEMDATLGRRNPQRAFRCREREAPGCRPCGRAPRHRTPWSRRAYSSPSFLTVYGAACNGRRIARAGAPSACWILIGMQRSS